MVRKILRSLSKARCPKVIAIQEAKDLNILSLDALIGSLKTHEIELNEASKESNRKGKSIALKTTQKKSSISKAMKVVEDSDEDKMSLLIIMMKRMKLHIQRRRYQKHGSKERRRALSLKRTKRTRQSKMKLFASNAKNLDMSNQNVLD